MKKISFKPANLLFNIAVIMVLVTLFTTFSPIQVLAVSTVGGLVTGTLLGFVPATQTVAYMAAQREIWQSHLIGNYWADNAFAKRATQVNKADIYAGKFVHIPAINGKPGVTRNRTQFPAVPTDADFKDVFYMIDEFYIDPFRIPNAQNFELSFDARQSVVGEQSSAANQQAADWLLRNWYSYTQAEKDGTTTTMKAQSLRTSGDAVAAHVGIGNRKQTLVADFGAVKVKFNKADVPLLNRTCVIDSNMLDQVTQDPEYKKAWQVYEKELVDGTVAKIQGFDIFERSSVLKTNAAGTALTAYGSADPDDANASALFYHTAGVESAVGDVYFFENENRAEWYGDIVSSILRASGRIRRSDSCLALIQG